MFYGIEASTDLRCKNTVIKKFSSKESLMKWLSSGGGDFTCSDPVAANNWHHTFRHGYELLGRIDKKDKIFSDTGTSTYPRNYNDNLAAYIHKYGYEAITIVSI